MLWFAFWISVPPSAPGPAGILAHGLATAMLGVVAAALICYLASYLAPAMMGMKTGLPLAVVGTSTYGVRGGLLMPGFLMGILQFGWLAVNAWFSGKLLWLAANTLSSGNLPAWLTYQPEVSLLHLKPGAPVLHLAIGAIWALVAAFVGLKGIRYVARVATFLPLLPLAILVILTAKTYSGIEHFKPELLTAGAGTRAARV